MPASEARILANRQNAQRSTGPRTAEGKDASRRNAYKHGLAGRGGGVAEADAKQVEDRFDVFALDLKPRSPMGMVLLQAVAVASVKMDRASRYEAEAIALRVRHAADDFDEARLDQADELFDALAENPRTNLRRLRKSPEGVDRLIEGWRDLKADLTRSDRPIWTAAHLARAASMTGARVEQVEAALLGALSRAARGEPSGLEEQGGGGLDDDARRAWARARIADRIDAEIDALEAHYETLDFERIERDRAEAPGRALFDPSKEATLARRYEAAAQRDFYRALDEFRRAEAEFAARGEAARSPAPPSQAAPTARLASNRRQGPPPVDEPSWPLPQGPTAADPDAKGLDGLPLTIGRPPGSAR